VKILLWLPSILADMSKLALPRWLFVLLYKPASDARAEAENDLRNAERLTAYRAKKLLGE
jgi:hypothetical protein